MEAPVCATTGSTIAANTMPHNPIRTTLLSSLMILPHLFKKLKTMAQHFRRHPLIHPHAHNSNEKTIL
jgi:hypothetical protein